MADIADISAVLGVAATIAAHNPTRWWCRAATAEQERDAARLGLVQVRRLHQMRVSLPLEHRADIAVRSFRPGADEDAWLEVNNRAFAWHPDQGGWTREDLHQRLEQPWFDAAGFLLHESPEGGIAGFCWTKYHAETSPPMGEIFAIGIDPTYQGRGLGRGLTIAGFDWLWRNYRAPVGMLYVEHDNTAAISLYRSLGLTIHHDDVAYEPADDR